VGEQRRRQRRAGFFDRLDDRHDGGRSDPILANFIKISDMVWPSPGIPNTLWVC
jgi:hypothetical protein